MSLFDLSPGHVQVIHVALPLIVLLILGTLGRGIPRVLLLAQTIYWSLSYIPRPLVLLAVTPQPSFGDDLADPRLAITGYDYNVAHVLAPVAAGLWIYAAVVAAFVIWQRMSPGQQRGLQQLSPTAITTLAVIYVFGVLIRFYSYFTGQAGTAGEVSAQNPYLTFLTDAGSVGAIGLIVFVRMATQRLTVLVIAVVMAGELVWGMAAQSKTPFIGAVLALIIRLSATNAVKLTFGRVVAVAAAAVGVGAIFGWLQSFKENATTVALTAGADDAYPDAVKPFLSMFRRFDLFAASTDSYFLNGRTYLSVHDVLTRLLLNCIPQQFGVAKIPSGTDWATRVRGSSVDMSNVSVSLAEGFINEGYAVHGYLGVTLEAIFLVAIIAATARVLTSRHIPLIAIGLNIIAASSLFERGALGISEVVGKGLQQAALAAVVATGVWLIRELRARGRPDDASDTAMDTDNHPPNDTPDDDVDAESARKVLT